MIDDVVRKMVKRKKTKYVYAVYSDTVRPKERYSVPNFCKIGKYGSRKKALTHADKRFDEKVYRLSLRKVRQKCSKKFLRKTKK